MWVPDHSIHHPMQTPTNGEGRGCMMGCSKGRQVRDTEHTNNVQTTHHQTACRGYIIVWKKITFWPKIRFKLCDLKHKISKQNSPLSFNKWRPAIWFPSQFKVIRGLRYSGICYCVVGWMVPDVLQALCFFKTTATTHPLTQCHISQNLKLQKHSCEN